MTVTVFGKTVSVDAALAGEVKVMPCVYLTLWAPINGQLGAGITLEHGANEIMFVGYEQGAQAAVDAAAKACKEWLAAMTFRSTD
jgi:hypothetical protein